MENGDFVLVDYVGRLESGEIFDLTKEDVAKEKKVYSPSIKYKPVTVVMGAGFVIPGMEKALLAMKEGEKKHVEIEPQDAFGQRNAEMIKTVNSKIFKERDVDPKPGMIVDFSGLKGRIQSASSGRVTVDFNNPLAGKKLIYDIEAKKKLVEPKEQITALMEFFGKDKASVTISNGAAEIESDLPKEMNARAATAILQHVKPEGKALSKVRFIQTFEAKTTG